MPVPRKFDRRPPERDQTRINDRIRVPEVRLIGEDGKHEKPSDGREPEAAEPQPNGTSDGEQRPEPVQAESSTAA